MLVLCAGSISNMQHACHKFSILPSLQPMRLIRRSLTTWLGDTYGKSYLRVHLPGILDDDRDGEVHIVRIDQAHGEACESSKGSVHCSLAQNLQAHLFGRTSTSLVCQECRILPIDQKLQSSAWDWRCRAGNTVRLHCQLLSLATRYAGRAG